MMADQMQVPTELDFLTVFGIIPEEARPGDGYWCYRFEGAEGVSLRFSFNTHERSVQTILTCNQEPLAVVVHELAESVEILQHGAHARIHAVFSVASHECQTLLRILVLPKVHVQWSSIRR